jgi:hypothetical protein
MVGTRAIANYIGVVPAKTDGRWAATINTPAEGQSRFKTVALGEFETMEV